MEGRRKEVLLLALAVAALGLALYTFRSKPAPTAAPAPAAGTQEATKTGTESGGPSAAGTEGEEQVKATPGTAAAGEQRNPFAAPGGAAGSAAMPAGTQKPTTAKAQASAAAAATGVEPPPGPQPGAPAQPTPEQPEKPSLTLTGIVNGKPNVAILRQDDQRYFVKVGDTVGGNYRVQSIGSQQVVLSGQQGKVILKMGGRQ